MCMVEKSVAWLATSEQRRFHIIAFRATISFPFGVAHICINEAVQLQTRTTLASILSLVMKLTPEILEAFR